MMKRQANSIYHKGLLGIAGAVFSLFLVTDGALVSAGSGEQGATAGVFQAAQTTAQVVYQGSVRFVTDMRALYQLNHLDEIVPQSEPYRMSPRQKRERGWIFLCSESQAPQAPEKSST